MKFSIGDLLIVNDEVGLITGMDEVYLEVYWSDGFERHIAPQDLETLVNDPRHIWKHYAN